MKWYLIHWRAIIFVALLLNILIFGLIMPYLLQDSKIEESLELAQVEDNLVESTAVEEEHTVEVGTDFDTPEFEFPPIFIPDTPNYSTYVEEVPRMPIQNRTPLPRRQPIVTKEEAEVLDQLERSFEEIVEEKPQIRQQLSKAPVILKKKYPPADSKIDYKGSVIVMVRIDTNGIVKDAKVIKSSGRLTIDDMAVNAAREWIFDAALDESGKAMECDKVITFEF